MTTFDSEGRPDVPIVVPDQSKSTRTDRQRGPAIHSPDYTVVVPVIDEIFETDAGLNVRRFVQTALALAADNDGRVLLLGLATVDSEVLDTIRAYIHEQETAAGIETDAVGLVTEQQTQIARLRALTTDIHPEVSVSGVVRTVTETTQGVLDAVDRRSETAVLLLRGTSLEEGWLLGQSTIDAVLEDADCDVFVENIGAQGGTSALYVPDAEEHTVVSLSESAVGPIDSVLLPVGTGPHAALAAEAARAIARAAEAPVTIIHVVSPDASEKATDDAEDLLRFAEYILGSDVEMTSELISATDTTDTIIQHAQEHDVTSIGAPEAHSGFKNLIFESIQETLTERNDVTVLMARDADRTMRSLYYRWKQGMETEARPDDN